MRGAYPADVGRPCGDSRRKTLRTTAGCTADVDDRLHCHRRALIGSWPKRLAERGVFVSHGNFYAATVIERLGLGTKAWSALAAHATRRPRKLSGWLSGVREIAKTPDLKT